VQHEKKQLTLPDNIDDLVARLPASIVERVHAEFVISQRHAALQILASYGEQPHENWGERVWNEILDQAHGDKEALKSLVLVAKADHRDLFYSSRDDPDRLLGKLLKRLRIENVLTDQEVAEATQLGQPPAGDASKMFRALCQLIGQNKLINADQYQRICLIGELLRYPPHSLDWLKKHLVE